MGSPAGASSTETERRTSLARANRISAITCAVAIAAAGCSAIGDGNCDDCGSPADGGAGGDARPGELDGGQPTGPFSEPRLIEVLSDPLAGDADPSMTDDGRELYFSSNRAGSAGVDIWVSRRDSVEDDWGMPEPVGALNSADAELDPEISFDGRTIIFNSTRAVEGAKGAFDLFISVRDSREDPWSPPELIPLLNSSESDMAAVMDGAQTSVVFHRTTATAMLDLYVAERSTPDDDWGTPMRITGLDTDDQEADPWMSADGRTLYFNSNRIGGSGDSDIYQSTRLTATSLFSVPDELGEINTDSHEANVALSLGGRYLVMSSARSGDHELWEASR